MERSELWASLEQPLDLLIIGGGITGAGILREAVRSSSSGAQPLRVLLVEQRDFAWGTSSRSSKLVHGGLRYLKQGQIGLTRHSVQERQHLLQEGPGLIDPLGFLLTVYEGDNPGRWVFELGLTVYDLLALQWDHHYYRPEDFRLLAPHLAYRSSLQGGFRYGDAQTDDARLVLRLIAEAQAQGGMALNYVSAVGLLRSPNGCVTGAVLRDQLTQEEITVSAGAVVNATGVWADGLRGQVGAPARIRPLRGSHLVFPAWRLPVAQAVSFLHPIDNRPVFIFPWEGVTLVGTTDVDHGADVAELAAPGLPEPAISAQETAYLMAAVEAQFPTLGIGLADVLSTFSGVRPVIGSGKADPSQESREHVVWEEAGLLTVTGGKLTTFRLIAQDALEALRARLPGLPEFAAHQPVLDPVDRALPGAEGIDEALRRRLLGRYGAAALSLVQAARPGELERIPGTHTVWAELRWAARSEQVAHLDDLLLRRVRLGLTLPGGAVELLPAVRAICQAELGWDDDRWQAELERYQAVWRSACAVPAPDQVPDWKAMLEQARQMQQAEQARRMQRLRRLGLGAACLSAAAALGLAMAAIFSRRKRSMSTRKPAA